MKKLSDGEKELLGEGRHVRLVRRRGWEYAERKGNLSGIVVIVGAAAGKAVLVSQWREPVETVVVEWPAGLAGDSVAVRGEALEAAARRELEEETGFVAQTVEKLWAGPPSAGLSDEVVTFFHASGLVRKNDGGGVGDEQIQVHLVPLEDAEAWLAAAEAKGWLVDPKVWAGLYWLRAHAAEE